MATEITNLPQSMRLLPAESIDDFNSLNYMRKQAIWGIRRTADAQVAGAKQRVPDDAPPNFNPPGM